MLSNEKIIEIKYSYNPGEISFDRCLSYSRMTKCHRIR